MKTLQQAVIWARQQVGKTLNWGGWSQCVSELRYYIQFLGYDQFPPVNAAKDIAGFDFNPAQFTKLGPNDGGQPGDMMILGPSRTNPFGHCNIVVERQSGKLITVDQNYVNPVISDTRKDGSPIALATWTFPNPRIICFIRPTYAIPQQPAPANQPPAAQPAPQPAGSGKYTVQKGDTFWGLENQNAWAHGTLQQLNPGVRPEFLQIGQQINVPAPKAADAPQPKRRIVAGDTFWDLEKVNGWPHGTLQNLNPGVNPRLLQIGQEINVPH